MSRFRALALVVPLTLTVLLAAAAPARAASAPDFAGDAFNVFPPGQTGAIAPTPSSTQIQIPLYDGLTPRFDISDADLPTFFKPNIFGLGGQTPERIEQPPQRPGLTIERDNFGVPHVTADRARGRHVRRRLGGGGRPRPADGVPARPGQRRGDRCSRHRSARTRVLQPRFHVDIPDRGSSSTVRSPCSNPRDRGASRCSTTSTTTSRASTPPPRTYGAFGPPGRATTSSRSRR